MSDLQTDGSYAPQPPSPSADQPVVAPAGSPAPQLSPDGRFMWNGAQWVPAQQPGYPPGATAPPVMYAQPVGYPQPQMGYPQPPMGYPQPPMMGGYVVTPKSPGLCVLASFFIPGLGSIIAGEAAIGGILLGCYIVSLVLILLLIGFITTPILWVAGMIHAYTAARNWNLRHGILS